MFERELVLTDGGRPSTASGLRVVYAVNVFDMAMHNRRRAGPPPVQQAVRNVMGH